MKHHIDAVNYAFSPPEKTDFEIKRELRLDGLSTVLDPAYGEYYSCSSVINFFRKEHKDRKELKELRIKTNKLENEYAKFVDIANHGLENTLNKFETLQKQNDELKRDISSAMGYVGNTCNACSIQGSPQCIDCNVSILVEKYK